MIGADNDLGDSNGTDGAAARLELLDPALHLRLGAVAGVQTGPGPRRVGGERADDDAKAWDGSRCPLDMKGKMPEADGAAFSTGAAPDGHES